MARRQYNLVTRAKVPGKEAWYCVPRTSYTVCKKCYAVGCSLCAGTGNIYYESLHRSKENFN